MEKKKKFLKFLKFLLQLLLAALTSWGTASGIVDNGQMADPPAVDLDTHISDSFC